MQNQGELAALRLHFIKVFLELEPFSLIKYSKENLTLGNIFKKKGGGGGRRRKRRKKNQVRNNTETDATAC